MDEERKARRLLADHPQASEISRLFCHRCGPRVDSIQIGRRRGTNKCYLYENLHPADRENTMIAQSMQSSYGVV